MRALLIFAAEEVGIMVPLPLGLACVGAATERAGHDICLLVLPPNAAYSEAISREIERIHPDVIGVSVRNIDNQDMQCPQFLLASIKEMVAACRSFSRAPIIAGGAGFSIFPESTLAYLGADFGIQGEGEAAFPALLYWLEQGKKGVLPPGLCLPNSQSTTRSFVRNLDELPLPRPELWLGAADPTSVRVPVQSRRGCPLNCSYCSTGLIEGHPVRARSPQSVVKWMARLCELGFRKFFFVDNTFNLPPSYAKKLCREILRVRLGIEWWAIVYPKLVDAELAELMAIAGCTQVSLGFESGSEPVLRHLNKRFTCSEVRTISNLFAAAGVRRNGFLLLGGPGETRDTVEESLAFAESLHLDDLKITVGIRIYPHTSIARIAVTEGLIGPDTDLLLPHFYMTPALREWLPARIVDATRPGKSVLEL